MVRIAIPDGDRREARLVQATGDANRVSEEGLSQLVECAKLVRIRDEDRWLSAQYASPLQRQQLLALYTFATELRRIPLLVSEPPLGEIRLQWWRDELEEIGEGTVVRRHEVVSPLAGFLDGPAVQSLDALVAARRWDVYKDPFEDEAHFAQYIDATSGNLMWVAARALGEVDETVVRDFAYGVGVANWLRAIPDLESRKRVPSGDGRPEAVALLADGALLRLRGARKHRSKLRGKSGQALLVGWQAEAVLQQAAANPGLVAEGALGQSDFQKNLTLMLRSLSGRW